MFVVRGLTAKDDTVYYTGRAGQGFVSVSLAEAYGYNLLGGAQHRVNLLNNATLLHGITFTVYETSKVEA